MKKNFTFIRSIFYKFLHTKKYLMRRNFMNLPFAMLVGRFNKENFWQLLMKSIRIKCPCDIQKY